MEKVVVISCTNRPDSNTLKVSRIYADILGSNDANAKILDFCSLPENIAFSETFGRRTKEYTSLIREYISETRKFIFIVPEYNGSFPGILKIFLDSVPPKEWADKDACLVGVADGRGGNIRGLEHLTSILNYLKMHVYHNKLPISGIAKVLGESGKLSDKRQMKDCEEQVKGFLSF
jgi:chromate reductase, NAD(P)H dehydrogenase (quinone)